MNRLIKNKVDITVLVTSISQREINTNEAIDASMNNPGY